VESGGFADVVAGSWAGGGAFAGAFPCAFAFAVAVAFTFADAGSGTHAEPFAGSGSGWRVLCAVGRGAGVCGSRDARDLQRA
jgi:hypothetical protein